MILVLLIGKLFAQDTTFVKPEPFNEKRHEFGLGVLSPFLMLTGAKDVNERFTNLTYRYRVNQKHAFKLLVGTVMFDESEGSFKQERMLSVPGKTVYLNTETRVPTNIQTGLGYELILGKSKLKHAIGIDLIYNNKFVSENSFYVNYTETTDTAGYKVFNIKLLDTGMTIKTRNYDKFGANLSYNLRYELSPRWALTGSFILNYRYYERRVNGLMAGISDFNINGLVSDISIFYRF